MTKRWCVFEISRFVKDVILDVLGKITSKLPFELLAYCIMVRPYRVSERFEAVSGHHLDTTMSRFSGSTIQHLSGANETATTFGAAGRER